MLEQVTLLLFIYREKAFKLSHDLYLLRGISELARKLKLANCEQIVVVAMIKQHFQTGLV